jgi:hypothetical protein
MNDKEINDKLLLAIRLYEINKDIHLFKTFLDVQRCNISGVISL